MQEPTIQNAQGGQTAPPPADEAQGMEAFLGEIQGLRGPTPGVSEGMDETQRLILENQYKQDTRNMVQDIETAIREVSPDVTRADIQKFARAFVEGDPMTLWQAAQSASRKEAEAEQNDEKSEDLRVEGAGSGERGSERAPIKSPQDAILQIADAFA